jgi:putative peptidoglycan lipid II flippase
VSKHLQSISVVAGATMISRLLGLWRDILITAVFGASALASAFYAAFTLPNLFRRLLGEGALTAAFVPTLSSELRERERAGAFALVNQVASWLLVATGGIVAIAIALLLQARMGADWALAHGAARETTERFVRAADLAVVLFPYLCCVCLAAVFSAALQTLNRFLEPALSPIWLNVSMITLLTGGAYFGWGEGAMGAMRWLCAGVLLGGFLQLLVPALALRREGWVPRLDLGRGEPLRQIIALMGPTVFGSAVYLINMSVSQAIGLQVNASSVAVLNLASRLMELPIGVFAVAVTTVVFPLISRYAAAGDWANMATAYRKGMRLILTINVPAAVGLFLLAEPVIRVLFQRGAFTSESVAAMRPVLMVYALGLPFLSFTNIVLRAFYAQRDTVTPVKAAVLSFIANLSLSLLLMGPLGTLGLAVAGNVATLVQAVYLQVRLARTRDGFGFHHVFRDLGKVLLAAIVMGALVALVWRTWVRLAGTSTPAMLIGLGAVIALGVGAYAIGIWLLRIEGRDDLMALVRRRLKRAEA